jgi:hypothetical protein
MSEQEKREKEVELAKNIAALPPELRERFLDQVTGAAMALSIQKEKTA